MSEMKLRKNGGDTREIHCPQCYYNLHGVLAADRSGTCPECGRVFDPGELTYEYTSASLEHLSTPMMLLVPVLVAGAIASPFADLRYVCVIIPTALALAPLVGIYCSMRHALDVKRDGGPRSSIHDHLEYVSVFLFFQAYFIGAGVLAGFALRFALAVLMGDF